MRVLGLMSGTSADGIDVALVQISGRGLKTRARLENHCTFPYSAAVRRAVLRVANANRRSTVSTAEISQLNFLLGELAADAVKHACRRFGVSLKSIGLIGSHGQTVYHQGQPQKFAGRRLASTLQLGEPAIIAERTSIPVVANFRPRDIAAGGQGAPLVPYVDYLLYRHPRRGRVALNLGGIANLTVIPAAARPEDVIAFDTGPANMIIDAVVERVTRGRLRFDSGGRLAAQGDANEEVLRQLLRHPFFRRRPPKSAGREQFGEAFVEDFLRRMGRARPEDKIRTAAELTARSLVVALEKFVLPLASIQEIIVGGGGARNQFLLRRLQELLPSQRLLPSGQLGIDAKAKEAFAFAVLAYQTWHGEPASLPSATGARRAVLLGTIVPAGKV